MNCKYKQDDWLGAQLDSALHAHADALTASPELDERVQQSLTHAPRRCMIKEKKFGRRLALTFCALFCLSCVGVIAAVNGAGGGWVSHAALDYRFNDFAQAASVAAHLDYEPQYVENLAGGFAFSQGHISEMQRLDENGQRMSHVYKDLFLDYVNSENGECLVFVSSIAPRTGEEGKVSRQIGEITVFYNTQPYKFVPVDYELTEEDLAALADGSLEISVGTDEVEQTVNNSVSWQQDGVHYLLFGWDLSLTADEMFALAEDFINRTSK